MLKASVAVIAAGLLLPLGLMAQGHPHYRRALQDLRFARAVLEQGEGWNWGRAARDQQVALNEIDRAIQEVRRAVAEDGGNMHEHPPVDVHWPARDRLRRAMEALDHARDAISQGEVNPAARGMKDRAYRHIDMARHALRHAMDGWRG